MRNVYYVCLCCLLFFNFSLLSFAQDDYSDARDQATIIIDEKEVQFNDSIYMENGRLFAPVRNVIEYFDGVIEWDSELKQLLITTPYDEKLVFTINEYEMEFNKQTYIMDVAPFMLEDRTYLPIRHLAEFLHAEVDWDAETNTASINKVPLYDLEEGEAVIALCEKLGISLELLEERNQISALDLRSNEDIKVVIPSIMENKLQAVMSVVEVETKPDPEEHPDFDLLARIIQVEAGYESYEGQVAVGSVIMNRVNSDRFPDTIYDVIYAPNQFPPAHNGLLDESIPNESVLKATRAVLNGENNVEGALFFHNPDVSWDEHWAALDEVKIIGNHRFAK